MHRRVGNPGSTEDGWSEDGDPGNTDPFLHDLEPDDELDATASVELAGSDTEEHREVRRMAGRLSFKFSNVANILKFGFGFASICACFPSKTAEDVTGFFLTTDFHKPTR